MKFPEYSGENHPNWIKDRTKIKRNNERGGNLHKEWSKKVKLRDGWKCKISNQDCNGKIVAHHILSWRDHPKLRYIINNGISLCKFHHPRKRIDEKQSVPVFLKLLDPVIPHLN